MTRALGCGAIAAVALLAVACAMDSGRSTSRLALPASPGPGARPAHVVVVSIAGLTSDLYRGDRGAMPHLSRLAREGVAADAVRSVMPASPYPAHATLVTGQPPRVHGIVADHRLGKRGVRAARYSHASLLRAPTLWQKVVQTKRVVASLAWPSTVGASIPLLLPDVEIGLRSHTWLDALADSTTPQLLRLAAAQGGGDTAAATGGPARDAVLVGVACELVASPQPPALLLIRLSQTAVSLALAGPDSSASRAAFGNADDEIARLLECLVDAGRIGATAFVVVGDHGVLPMHTLISPNKALESRGFITVSEDLHPQVISWTAISRSNGGSAFVYAEEAQAALLARRALTDQAERTGAFRVVSAEEMLGLGGDPDAWFGLEAEPGFAFSDSVRGPLLQPAAGRGAAGYLPDQAGMDAGFVAWGRGIRRGVRVPTMRQEDVAPTLARLLGVEMDDAAGRVLVGAIGVPVGGKPKDAR